MSLPLALVQFSGCVSFPGSEPEASLFWGCAKATDSLYLWGPGPLIVNYWSLVPRCSFPQRSCSCSLLRLTSSSQQNTLKIFLLIINFLLFYYHRSVCLSV